MVTLIIRQASKQSSGVK